MTSGNDVNHILGCLLEVAFTVEILFLHSLHMVSISVNGDVDIILVAVYEKKDGIFLGGV